NRGRGVEELKLAVLKADRTGPAREGPVFPEAFQIEAAELAREVPAAEPFLVQRLLLDVGGHTETSLSRRYGTGLSDHVRNARNRLSAAGCGVPAVEARTRYGWIRQALACCVERPAVKPVLFADRLDRVLTHKVWGTFIFLGLMFLVFESIFIWA